MANTFYVDYVLGNDANAGTSWGSSNAFKTISAVTAAKGFVSGDSVRVAKGSDPSSLSQTAQWTDNSKTIVLTSAVTQTLDNCEVAWTKAAATSTSTSTSAYRQGTKNITISTGTPVANTLYAYNPITPGDLSGYQQLSFWVQSSVATTDPANWRLCLCSDAAGQTILYSFPIPVQPMANSWTPFAVDLAIPLSGTIQSIALYSGAVVGASSTLSFDNIFACKASNQPDALTLLSLIGKNARSEAWYAMSAIDGVNITIDNHAQATSFNLKPYGGITENVTLWKREAIRTSLVATSATNVQSLMIPTNSQISISGGWNPATGLQGTDDTFFDGQNSQGVWLNAYVSGVSYSIQNISLSRYNIGISGGAATQYMYGCSMTAYQLCNNQTGISTPGHQAASFNVTNASANNSGINPGYRAIVKALNANSNSNGAFGPSQGTIIQATNVRSNNYGTSVGQTFTIMDATFANNSNPDVEANSGNYGFPIYVKNCVLGRPLSVLATGMDARIYVQNDGQVVGAHRIFSDGMTIVNDTSTVHTAGGTSWKISPTGAVRTAYYPAWLVIARVFCAANQSRTFSAWFRRDNIGISGQLVIRGGKIKGIPDTVSDTMTAAAGTWDKRSITVTPTEDGIIEIEAWAYGGTTYNVWCTEFSAS